MAEKTTYLEKPDYSADAGSTMDLSGIRGWDNTRQVVVDYSDNNLFLGVPNVTQNTLPFIEPFIGGYGRVFCLQAPIFFEPNLRTLMSRIIERLCRGLSGLSNYELQTTEIQYGNNAETYTVPTGIKKGNNNFNLRFMEMQGGIIRKIMKYWITGISDLGSGYGTYHGKTWKNGLRFSAVNHSSIMLYALTDNSGGAYGLSSIEFACMWYGVFPTTVNNSHFEYTQGEHNTAELDLPFYGIYHENNTINSFAAELLMKSNFYKDNYDEFDLGPLVWEGFENRNTAAADSGSDVVGFEPMQADSTQYSSVVKSSGFTAENYVDPSGGQ